MGSSKWIEKVLRRIPENLYPKISGSKSNTSSITTVSQQVAGKQTFPQS